MRQNRNSDLSLAEHFERLAAEVPTVLTLSSLCPLPEFATELGGLVDLGLHAERREIDKIVKGLKLHG